jgi:hypothetical protein
MYAQRYMCAHRRVRYRIGCTHLKSSPIRVSISSSVVDSHDEDKLSLMSGLGSRNKVYTEKQKKETKGEH